jgi:hypothetical protein
MEKNVKDIKGLTDDLQRKWEPQAICDICEFVIIYLYEDGTFLFGCDNDDDCIGCSKFKLKPKKKWYHLKVANFITNQMVTIKIAGYHNGEWNEGQEYDYSKKEWIPIAPP